MTRRQGKYPDEVRRRIVRLVLEHRDEYDSEWAAITSIAAKSGMTAETVRKWVRRAEIDEGLRPGVTSEESHQIRELRLRTVSCVGPMRSSRRRRLSLRRSSTAHSRDDRLYR